jgi:xanthine/uracil/vitamin C permease (AzgA family)
MNRTRILITVVAFLATFAWLLAPELKVSPAVLWPSVLAVGLAFVARASTCRCSSGRSAGPCCSTAGIPGLRFTIC